MVGGAELGIFPSQGASPWNLGGAPLKLELFVFVSSF